MSIELECGEVTTGFWEEGQCNSEESLEVLVHHPGRGGCKYQKNIGFSPVAKVSVIQFAVFICQNIADWRCGFKRRAQLPLSREIFEQLCCLSGLLLSNSTEMWCHWISPELLNIYFAGWIVQVFFIKWRSPLLQPSLHPGPWKGPQQMVLSGCYLWKILTNINQLSQNEGLHQEKAISSRPIENPIENVAILAKFAHWPLTIMAT